MSKKKKEAPAPARDEAGAEAGHQDSVRIAPNDSAELPAGLVWTMPTEPALPECLQEQMTCPSVRRCN